MSQDTDLDLGPLTWVKGEIDLALERAAEAIGKLAENPEDSSPLKFARTHLHQAHGALSMVALDGVTQFSEAAEQTLAEVEAGKLALGPAVTEALQQALGAIRQYLDEVAGGAPNQPLKLLPAYRELQAVRGIERVAPSELFFPDLSRRPPRRDRDVPALSGADLQRRLRSERLRFERGFLRWLRSADDTGGLREMRSAVAAIEETQALPAARAFWWITLALLDALIEGQVPVDLEVKKLCARVDLQVRRLLEGSRTVAERLMRDVMYYVAIAQGGGEHVEQVRAVYRLADLIPPTSLAMAVKPVLRTLREGLTAAKDSWNKFCAGAAVALPQFHEQALQLVSRGSEGALNDSLSKLLAAIALTASWLRREPLKHSDSVAMEMATALLLAESAVENYEQLSEEFTDHAQLVTARLNALVRGDTPPPLEAPLLDEMSRRAQERLLMSQVAREIKNNLAQIEQTLDAFFRDSSQRDGLATIDGPIRQVEGALMMLGHDDAAGLLHACAERIGTFSSPDYQPDEQEFAEIAHKLSGLGFFVDALQHGKADLETVLQPLQPRSAGAEPADEPAELSMERALARQQRETQSLIEALKDRPDSDELREELKQNLEAIRQEANLVADSRLEQDARAALAALDNCEADELAKEVERAVSPPLREPTPVAAPSADTLRLAEAPVDEIDAELLAIFLEEAHEVLNTIDEYLALSRTHPYNQDYLTTIRRGFHTLKGSGRMVGLTELGEAAWGIEQLMNRWLQSEKDATEDLHALIADAHNLFCAWVEQLESGAGTAMDATAVLAAADRVKSALIKGAGSTSAATPATPQAPPETTAADARAAEGEASAQQTEPEQVQQPLPDLPAAEADGLAPALLHDAEAAEEEILIPELDIIDLDAPGEEEIRLGATTEEIEISLPEDDDWLADAETANEEAAGASAAAIDDAGEVQATSLDIEHEATEGSDAQTPSHTGDETVGDMAPAAVQAEDVAADMTPSAPIEEAAEGTDQAQAEVTAADDGAAETPAPEPAAPAEDGVTLGETTVSRPLYEMYLTEARGHLTALRGELNYLKLAQQVPPAQMIRAAHTLAGISGTVGLESVSRLAQALEHALDRLKQSGQPCNSELIGLIGGALSTLDAMVAVVADQRVPNAAEGLVRELDDIARPRTVEDAPTADVIELAAFMEPVKAPADQALPEAQTPAAPTVQGTSPGEPRSDEATAEAPAAPGAPAASRQATTEPHGERRVARLQDDIDPVLLPIFLEEAHDLCRQIGADMRQWRVEPQDKQIPQTLSRLLHTLKGSARMAGAMALGELVHSMETRVEQAAAAGVVTPAFLDEFEASFDRGLTLIEHLEKGTVPPAEDEDAAAGPAAADRTALEAEPELAAQRLLRVRADVIDRLVNEAGEMSIARSRIDGEMRTLRQSLLELTENVIRLRNQLREIEIQAESQMQSRMQLAQETHNEFDPLEFDRFTRFQELTRMMAESVNDVTTVQHNLLKNLDQADAALVSQSRLNRELSQSLMSVRMMPFNSLAERLYRVVRQTAKELGKKANLDIRGGQIELDRSVLEKMAGPLEHLLRNAITHGLEPREQRLAAGKPEIGQINLTLVQEGNEVAIVLTDDGAGLDYERIRAKAIEQNLLDADQQPDEAALTEFIFHPGFSTAAELSELAGRGVGMDVVRSETAQLGGRIEVSSEPGKGAGFRIYLPLTLAVTQALLVRTGNRTYAIPSTMVEQAMELKQDAVERIRSEGQAEWLGNRYPYHYLPNLLGDLQSVPEVQRRTWVLLLRSGKQRIAVQVDELRGNQEIVVKNIGPQLARVIGISGATVLGDGEVVLIINPVTLAGREHRPMPERPAPAAHTEASPTAAGLPTVMIVDDSLTVRKITGRLLAREGYQVLTAKDGVDALEQMLDVIPDVLLVDIEMPRMDGFDFTRNVRADARTRDVPIIMITSRTAEKHRNYAKEIGVQHYLGKPYQEDELLALIAQYARTAVTSDE